MIDKFIDFAMSVLIVTFVLVTVAELVELASLAAR